MDLKWYFLFLLFFLVFKMIEANRFVNCLLYERNNLMSSSSILQLYSTFLMHMQLTAHQQ